MPIQFTQSFSSTPTFSDMGELENIGFSLKFSLSLGFCLGVLQGHLTAIVIAVLSSWCSQILKALFESKNFLTPRCFLMSCRKYFRGGGEKAMLSFGRKQDHEKIKFYATFALRVLFLNS